MFINLDNRLFLGLHYGIYKIFGAIHCIVLYFRILYLPVLLFDERQCKETVEDTPLLWKIKTH